MVDTEAPILRRAFAQLMKRRFEDFERGEKQRLGELLGAEGRSAATRASRLIAGDQFPDRQWETVAEFLHTTPAGLLRELADEVENLTR